MWRVSSCRWAKHVFNVALSIHDVQLVIASTTTPDQVTPSLACRVAAALAVGWALLPVPSEDKSGKSAQPTLPAYDINAACSGYLFALAQAFDFLQHQPTACALVITSEVLSPLLDLSDFDTAPLFADAATATLLVGPEWHDAPRRDSRHSEIVNPSSRDREGVVNFNQRLPLPDGRGSVDQNLRASRHTLRLHRPIISGRPEDGTRLSVPLYGHGSISMSGKGVFTKAVRAMTETLAAACAQSGLTISDLNQVIPHQANQRILDAVAKRAAAPVFSNIRHRGNSSSSTIPLALSELLMISPPQSFGLASFGGGFTFGAAIGFTTLEYCGSTQSSIQLE